MRRARAAVVAVLIVVAGAGPARALSPAESCLAMRLATLGSTISTRLHCQAWAVGTRTSVSDACLAHADDDLGRKLRGAGCASDAEIATLLELARAGSETMVESQIVGSRVAEFENALWISETIVDLRRPYTPDMAWPDTSCRSTGHCPDLYILTCDSVPGPDGTAATQCRSAPESAFQVDRFPVFNTENVSLPTGEILARVNDGSAFFEVVITLAPDGETYTGRGHIGGQSALFLSGYRAR